MFGVTVTSEGANAVVHVVPSSPITQRVRRAMAATRARCGAADGRRAVRRAELRRRTATARISTGTSTGPWRQGAHAVQGAILATGWRRRARGALRPAAGGRGVRCGRRLHAAVHRCGTVYSPPMPGGGWSAATNRLPSGNLETGSSTGTTLTVAGWAFDPDQPAPADGGARLRRRTLGDGADGGRVAAGRGRRRSRGRGPHGFSWSTTLGARVAHRLPVRDRRAAAVDAHGLGCRTVAVAMTLP